MSTILVIDDEKGILRLMHQALTKFGHNVETADGGLEGIRKFDDGCFDIVITDILSLIHISEPTRPTAKSRMPSSA